MQLAIRLREIIDLAKERPCKDCRNWYARAFGSQMTFDHLDPSRKLFNIGTVGVNDSNVLGHNLVTPQVLREEISKCDVVCRACHDKREKRRKAEKALALEARAREEACEAWRSFGRAVTIGHFQWLEVFDRLGRILARAHDHDRVAADQRARDEAHRALSLAWEATWTNAISNVVKLCSRGFLSPVFERHKVVKKEEKQTWKKFVNLAPRPWKADR